MLKERENMRLVTRSDFDGLVCGVLLVEHGIVHSYKFVHPKDIQDGKVDIDGNDVLANVPFVSECGLWFDHHASEHERFKRATVFNGATYPASSAAQVIWDYYGGERTFGQRLRPLLDAVNRSDSGQVTREEILNPSGWILLSFVMDPRTGLGRFSDYRIGNLKLMEDMIQYCRTKDVVEILELPDVKQRTARYFEQQELFKDMLLENSRAEGNIIVVDLRPCEPMYSGNRFLIYALYPDQNIEVRAMWGRERQNVVITCGHSIINHTSRTNVGRLMLKYGGGGHERVGTCQIPTEKADVVFPEIVAAIKADG